ncbi:hypothetical protein ACFWC2_14445 [Streptomyces diastaticus]|uniref:hypothetical protein n=1 Tax=Streptomyces TaxID=1883 RepID=UPI002A7F3CDF|nr:hypothetical protein [Streptomyces sp. S399]WPR52818.1 hypothetical protein SJI45_18965 [Streptomyces sp. S399]
MAAINIHTEDQLISTYFDRVAAAAETSPEALDRTTEELASLLEEAAVKADGKSHAVDCFTDAFVEIERLHAEADADGKRRLLVNAAEHIEDGLSRL